MRRKETHPNMKYKESIRGEGEPGGGFCSRKTMECLRGGRRAKKMEDRGRFKYDLKGERESMQRVRRMTGKGIRGELKEWERRVLCRSSV